MAKRNTNTNTNTDTNTNTPTSLKDAGYRFAVAGETTDAIVRYVLEQCPGFAEEVPKEVKTELLAGLMLRKDQLTGEKLYRQGDAGTLIPVTAEQAKDATGVVRFTVTTAMALTPIEFGKLRETEPARHAIIKALRDGFSTYASNRIRDMQRIARAWSSHGTERARAANKEFVEATKAVFDALEKRVKTASNRGDAGADPARFRMAVAAFWAAYKAAPTDAAE